MGALSYTVKHRAKKRRACARSAHERKVVSLAKLTVAVLFGGVSSEHEVSRLSASSVIENLDRTRYDVLMVGIKKDGTWHLYTGDESRIARGEWGKRAVHARGLLPGQRHARAGAV